MSEAQIPSFEIPDEDTLARNLSASVDIEDRIAYVRGLIVKAQRFSAMLETLDRERRHAEESKESMARELRALRQKVGALTPEEGAAVQARYEMQGRMTRARNELDTLERTMQEAFKRAKEHIRPMGKE